MAEFIYYNHSVNSRNDPRILALIDEYDFAGYAHFHMLLEQIHQMHSPILDLSNARMLKSVKRDHRMTEEELFSFVGVCVEVGLFDAEVWDSQRHVTSNGICGNFEYLQKKVEAGKKSGEVRRGKAVKGK